MIHQLAEKGEDPPKRSTTPLLLRFETSPSEGQRKSQEVNLGNGACGAPSRTPQTDLISPSWNQPRNSIGSNWELLRLLRWRRVILSKYLMALIGIQLKWGNLKHLWQAWPGDYRGSCQEYYWFSVKKPSKLQTHCWADPQLPMGAQKKATHLARVV